MSYNEKNMVTCHSLISWIPLPRMRLKSVASIRHLYVLTLDASFHCLWSFKDELLLINISLI